jgi:acid phosphatase
MTADNGDIPNWMSAVRRQTILRAIGTAMLSLAVAVASGCAHRPKPLYEAEQAVADYIASGLYLRDVSAVINDAQAYLTQRADGDTSKLAVVLDIDETALSNWPAYKLNNYSRILHGPCDLFAGPCGIFAYQAMGISPAIEPTRDLARTARQLGVKVYFLSGRSGAMQTTTERNLLDKGYSFDGVILYPEDEEKLRSAADFKAAERARLESLGLKIILCLGDQLSDLAGGHCERTFKLPNPVYFLP